MSKPPRVLTDDAGSLVALLRAMLDEEPLVGLNTETGNPVLTWELHGTTLSIEIPPGADPEVQIRTLPF